MRATELFLEWLRAPKGKDPDWVIEAGKRAEANKAAYEARKKEYADKWEAERPKSIKLKRVGKEVVEWKLGHVGAPSHLWMYPRMLTVSPSYRSVTTTRHPTFSSIHTLW